MRNLTYSDLKKVKACQIAINKFLNTKELHDIDIENINSISTTDESLFDDVNWAVIHGLFKIKKLSYTNTDGDVETYTYDERGNLLSETYPNGYLYTYTYNEQGNRLSYINFTYTCDDVYNLSGFVIE